MCGGSRGTEEVWNSSLSEHSIKSLSGHRDKEMCINSNQDDVMLQYGARNIGIGHEGRGLRGRTSDAKHEECARYEEHLECEEQGMCGRTQRL